MQTAPITHYFSNANQFASNEFEEAYYHATLQYSLEHLTSIGNIPHDIIIEAMQKSLQVCYLAGINSKHHFKQIYIFDINTGTLHIDWLMSKKGMNLIIMQIPFQVEKSDTTMARWLWELAD